MITVPGRGQPVEAVVLDWGGTLTEPLESELADMWELAARRLAPERPERVMEALFAVERASWARAATTLRSTRLMDLLLQASEELDRDVAEAVLSAARDTDLASWATRIRHRPDAKTVIAALADAGLRVGMVTNTHWPRAFHEQFLAAAGVAEMIQQRLYTAEIDWVKPHPQPFVTIAQRLRAPVERCLHVGDRPIDDVQGATEAGMAAVWLRNELAPGEPDGALATIERLEELPEVLGIWT